jgi:hypothetical protein
MIVPTPWRLVEDRAIILGRDGREVRLGGICPNDAPGAYAAPTLIVEWCDADGRTGSSPVDPNAIVPVVLPDMGSALQVLFAAFPETQILQITEG